MKIRAFEMSAPAGQVPHGPTLDRLKTAIASAETHYHEKTDQLDKLNAQFNEYSVVMVDANGREKQIPAGQIVRALRPNEMGMPAKTWIYLTNVWSTLADEPRDANT